MRPIALMLLFVGSLGLAWRMSGAAATPADFRVTIKTTDGGAGVEMECQRGCAWTKLTFACDGNVECAAVVDAFGVHGKS